MENSIVIFIVGLAVTMVVMLSALVLLIGSDRPEQPVAEFLPERKADSPRN